MNRKTFYIVKSPRGKYQLESLEISKARSRLAWLGYNTYATPWKVPYGQGYRCVRVRLEEKV